jgi:hypothetical protein
LLTWRHYVQPSSACKIVKTRTLFQCRKPIKFHIHFTIRLKNTKWNTINPKQTCINVFKIHISQNVSSNGKLNDSCFCFFQPTGTDFKELFYRKLENIFDHKTYSKSNYSFCLDVLEWKLISILRAYKHVLIPHIFTRRSGLWKYVAFYHISWIYIPYFTQTRNILLLYIGFISYN